MISIATAMWALGLLRHHRYWLPQGLFTLGCLIHTRQVSTACPRTGSATLKHLVFQQWVSKYFCARGQGPLYWDGFLQKPLRKSNTYQSGLHACPGTGSATPKHSVFRPWVSKYFVPEDRVRRTGMVHAVFVRVLGHPSRFLPNFALWWPLPRPAGDMCARAPTPMGRAHVPGYGRK